MDWLDEIEARADKATPGPWKSDLSEGDCGAYFEDCPRELEYCDDACPQCKHWEINQGACIYGPENVECGGYTYYTDEDAEFIAHAREDVPRLTAEVRALRADLGRVTAERDAAVARWVETASDNTNYTLTHSGDGMYAVADRDGHVVCEFLRIPCPENGGAP